MAEYSQQQLQFLSNICHGEDVIFAARPEWPSQNEVPIEAEWVNSSFDNILAIGTG